MEIIRRLLDPNTDKENLKMILEKYKKYVIDQPNSIYKVTNLIEHAVWIYNQFELQNPKYFKISGKFINGILTQIIVGYRIEIMWNREVIDALPFWCMGLLYFDDRQWRFPADEFRQLNSCINESFEEEECNTFYVVQKVSPKLLAMQNPNEFFTKDKYFKSLPYDRYHIVLERIFMNQYELDLYRDKFKGLRAVLPREILRPVMFVSARLDYFNLKSSTIKEIN